MTKCKAKIAKAGSSLGAELTVLDVIDGGGAEPVYLVWSHRDWCAMACKVMKLASAGAREAATLSAFSHPNILRTFGVRNDIYLLMPYIEGNLLSNVIDNAVQRPTTISNALRLAIYIGAALIHVHARGYLHMDVKPCNIIIASDGRPILFDFGSARKIGDDPPNKIIGTNAYIAPEECRKLDVGPAADVFSFGVTIYELLTGELPFGKRLPKKRPFPQLSTPLTPPRTIRPSIPAGLEALICACLDQDPRRRPQLRSLLTELHSFISSGPPVLPLLEAVSEEASHFGTGRRTTHRSLAPMLVA